MSTGVVIVAAGSGKRMGGQRNKLWLPLAGEPILAHTVRLFATHPDIDEVVLVVSEADHAEVTILISAEKLTVVVTLGGAERQDSVRNGLASLSANCDYVLVHDAARPFVTRKQISDMIKQVQQDQATIMAVPVKDTIKVVGATGLVESTPARESLWAVQTPQAFRMSLLREAHQAAEAAGKLGTDDAMLVEWLGHPVSIMNGSYENIKITTPDDLWFGEEILRKRKGE
ncbi:2-C-methyl-D-erythritol 4-phosphate cytidylyltransferase [Brevibacillus porteri]|uniref:2-C-methyl-D-erythritol 4-phosphate cytidylyltransferase n=1 Tax=Brevibacillus porteri TaxID=2126350 RepID=A0ABX5FPD0_9BACL|nr:2-C-methyl-D-erythritol 4-phosphate cytidylyltransferase [Brevibacillus porteri]MED1800749.1 2-C-methyl-D-erythritol 4-phosphate cytidylyltransferase [Brevibacillus porteri]MED2133251.1 2-C-methyl-D-erythritol 4-phosphate cytidylyltransferase [Brevibacillus porteri]MED2745995.1 2-C-methyl-D-erythritol 4-phosphate cytidylyltransferase [Brevibacillus porteri]MED2817430.1 2-C-methyl-D-erythritol 4-phosphate cytidylyltransferase [Brevibacillus porteri]MED2896239.1 2-C-methyl-D-erythritol 4-phos